MAKSLILILVAATVFAVAKVSSAASFDFQSAYNNAAPGAVIQVPAGTYGDVEIDHNSAHDSGPAVTFSFPDATTIASLNLGGPNGCIPDAPNWITFDGGTNKNLTIPGGVSSCVSDHQTIENAKLCIAAKTTGSCNEFHSPQNLVFQDNIIGPNCCGYDGTSGSSPIELRIAVASGDPNPTNVVVENNVFQGSARFCSDWDKYFSSYGACPSVTCPDTTQCHNDAIHVYGCTDCYIENNQFPYYDVQGIFLEEVNGGYEYSGTIANNVFGTDIEGADHTVWASFGCNANSGVCGTWTIAFNTSTDGEAGYDVNASDQHGRYGTGNIQVYGNLGGWLRNDTGGCQGSTLTVTYDFNDWSKGYTCGTDAIGANPVGFVNSVEDCKLVLRTAPCDAGAETGPPPPPPAPVAPGNPVVARACANGKYTFPLDWDAVSGATKYGLYVDGARVSTAGSKATQALFKVLCGVHVYGVSAINDSGESALSTVIVKGI